MEKSSKKPKMLLERAREVLRQKHYSIRTEASYIGWMREVVRSLLDCMYLKQQSASQRSAYSKCRDPSASSG